MSTSSPSTPLPPDLPTPGPWRALLFASAAFLGPAALLEPRLAIFALLLLVVALSALTRYRGTLRRLLQLACSFGVILALLGLGRFALSEALPGIVEASGRASGQRAVSRLREILFAQDASRRLGLIAADGNGVGSAGRLGELTGVSKLRPMPPGASADVLAHPPLGPHFKPRVTTPAGEAAEEGDYYYLVCVPGRDGRLTADPQAPVDEVAAKRRFVAYAWPAIGTHGNQHAFFIDEHERILESENLDSAGELRLVGAERPPSCHDALEPPHQAEWLPWRGKQPRQNLPGL